MMLRATFLKKGAAVGLGLLGVRFATPQPAAAIPKAQPLVASYEFALSARGEPLPRGTAFQFVVPSNLDGYGWGHASGWIDAPSKEDVDLIFRHHGGGLQGIYSFKIPAGQRGHEFAVDRESRRNLAPLRAGDTISIDVWNTHEDATGGRLALTFTP